MRPLVLDTNVVLDLLVFGDPRTAPLQRALDQGEFDWIATPAMQDELAHVLRYPNLAQRALLNGLDAAQVLESFGRRARAVDAAPACAVQCSDADDQKFIDLAVAHRSMLLSKDRQVLRLRRRMAPFGADVREALAVESAPGAGIQPAPLAR